MRIAELYRSLQGEGMLAGTPSVFVRTSGCNLRCHWCDTPFTSWEPRGDELSLAEIFAAVEALGRRHVVITGGEPLLHAETVGLGAALRLAGHHVTIETAGTVLPDPGRATPYADLVSISPKLRSSGPPTQTPADWARRHESSRRRDDVLAGLMADGPWQLKFVIDSPADFEEARAWLADLAVDPGRGAVFMMPQGVSAASLARTTAWLGEACDRSGFRLAVRHHIDWFGHTRST
jgi:7-carboxy-7-deazaguanine synthase